jgi:hypothetical protein
MTTAYQCSPAAVSPSSFSLFPLSLELFTLAEANQMLASFTDHDNVCSEPSRAHRRVNMIGTNRSHILSRDHSTHAQVKSVSLHMVFEHAEMAISLSWFLDYALACK